MILQNCKLICKFSVNSFCTSSYCLKGKFNLNQKSNLARKFLNKPIFPIENVIPPVSVKSSRKIGRKVVKPSFREVKLSKIFMENITDIISTSDISSQTANSGLEITQVQVMPGLTSLNVYWSCLRSKDEERINEVLVKATPYITYQLILLGVLGRIPPLVFVRDDSYKNLVEVDKLLQKADFGSDFEPSYSYPEPSSVIRQFDEPTEVSTRDQNIDDLVNIIGTLRQDVLGVSRDRILASVRKSLSGSRGEHRTNNEPISYSQVQRILEDSRESRSKGSTLTNYSRTKEIRQWASEYKLRRKASLSTKHCDADEHFVIAQSDDYEEIEEELTFSDDEEE